MTRMPAQVKLHHAHWPKGVPHELRVPQVTLNHFVQTAALRYPDKPALIYADRVLTYRQLNAQIEAVAAYLQQRLGVARTFQVAQTFEALTVLLESYRRDADFTELGSKMSRFFLRNALVARVNEYLGGYMLGQLAARVARTVDMMPPPMRAMSS